MPFFLLFLIILFVYLYWRFFFFFRDPERSTPSGDDVVSPADGTIVYIKKIQGDIVPISIKKKKEIILGEIFGNFVEPEDSSYLIGIFMHPTDVHVNRAPISGNVEKIIYYSSKNSPMTMMWWRVLFGIRPYESFSTHIFQNERNTILIRGKIPLYMVQIADIYVNKIECWVKEQEILEKGQRVGMIKMGSQVDVLFPSRLISNIRVEVGQKVRAGETIIAEMKQ